MNLYLTRHTSVDVPAGTCYGQTNVPLRSSFEEEAEKVQSRLCGLIFDRIYTSPLSRCERLSEFCGFHDAVRDDRIKELNFGQWEMIPFSSLTDQHARQWFDDWIHTPAPGGESFMDLYKRVSSFLDELQNQKLSSVCVFTHGGVITCARVYAKQYEIREAFEHIPSYGEVVKIPFA